MGELERCVAYGGFAVFVRLRTFDPTLLTFAGCPIPGPLVPQALYKHARAYDQCRYVEEIQLSAPISFRLANPDALGIPLRDAKLGKNSPAYAHLENRDEEVLHGAKSSISIRICVSDIGIGVLSPKIA